MNISFFDDKPNLDELDFKLDTLNKFKKINIESMINLLFYGQPSSGKSTQIYAFLASILDKRVYDLKNCCFEEDRKTMNYRASIYHIEINPIHLGSNEKLFIHSFLKSYVETRNIGLDMPKIVLIKDANLLSKQSQLALRRIIEKNSITTKFIFEVSSLSDFAEPLISRCLLIRVKIPSFDDIKKCLENFSKRHNFEISDKDINSIITESNKINNGLNLKKIFGFYRYFITAKKHFHFLYYDKFFEILNFILQKRISFINLGKIRDIINEMYINVIDMEELIYFLFNKLCEIYKDNNNFLYNLLKLTTSCQLNIKKGNKACLHVEYYVISIIELLQSI